MEQSGAFALETAQPEAFNNADAFDAYEVAQIEAVEQNNEASGMQKNKGAVVLAVVLIITLLLYGLK